MKIELWTDIICPWCGLGNHNLGLALRDFAERDRVELVHRSFQLDPDAPADVVRPVPQMLREKGYTDAQISGMTHRIEKMAREQGLQPYIVLDNTVGNTALAHELAAWASEQGKGEVMWNALYRAYFSEQRPIFDIESLCALAADSGFDPVGARAALSSRRYRDRVRADDAEARRLGANGVPFFVIDRRYTLAGAQPPDVLLRTLEQAWQTRTQSS